MAEMLTEQMLIDVARQFDNVPARFVVRNDAMLSLLRMALEKVETGSPPTLLDIPLVIDGDVPAGAVEVRSASGRVLKSVRLFELPLPGAALTLLPHGDSK